VWYLKCEEILHLCLCQIKAPLNSFFSLEMALFTY